MGERHKVVLDESCPHCGAGVTLHSSVDPVACPPGYTWWACDGDVMTCDKCDHVGRISVDDGVGHVVLNEDCGCFGCGE